MRCVAVAKGDDLGSELPMGGDFRHLAAGTEVYGERGDIFFEEGGQPFGKLIF